MADPTGRRGAQSGRLERLGAFVARRPRRVIAAWLLVLVVFGLFSTDLESKVSTRPVFYDGTGSKLEHEIAVRQFGSETAVVVLLRGPKVKVEHQGRRLESWYEAIPGALVVSPWSPGGSMRGLRPAARTAGLVVTIKGGTGDGITKILPEVRNGIAKTVAPPVHASVAGAPAIVESIQTANAHAVELGQWIAIPALMVILLLVFRSVFAALIPIVSGGAVVVASRGALSIIASLSHVDVLAIGAMGMMALALGVDYSLLIVSRFREEVEKGADAPEAMANTVSSTGRAVLMAGGGLSLAMLVAPLVLSGSIASSVSYAVLVATVLSVLSALFVVPALLTLLGGRLERWTLPVRREGTGFAARFSDRFSLRPWLVVLPILLLLGVAAAMALTLDTGALEVSLLPPGAAGRVQQEEVQQALGPGWVAPLEVALEVPHGPITTPRKLRALMRFQRRAEADPGVATVTNLRGLAAATRELEGVESQLGGQERALVKLGGGVSRARQGATLNTVELQRAASGADKLGSAIGLAGGGASGISDGLNLVTRGSERVGTGLKRTGGGSRRLVDKTAVASEGAAGIATGLSRARRQIGALGDQAGALEEAMGSGEAAVAESDGALGEVESDLAHALTSLGGMTVGKADTQYEAVIKAVEDAEVRLGGTGEQEQPDEPATARRATRRAGGQFSLGRYLSERLAVSGEQAGKGMAKLAAGSVKLETGLERLSKGTRSLHTGVSRLSKGGLELTGALHRLGDGTGRLTGSLGAIHHGTEGFAADLSSGSQQSQLLQSGLNGIGSRLKRGEGQSPLRRLRDRSPGLFRSGYFYLAGLDGTPSPRRRQAGFFVSLANGGSAARMLVVSRFDPSDPRAKETRRRLEGDAGELARETGADVALGGAGASQQDINTALRAQTPMARLVLALVTVAILILVLRSLLVPLLAGLLNLLTVAATFGILALVFDSSLLGGPGFVDTTVLPATIVVIFGLAIDYEVFVFARMREEYLRTGSTETAIAEGVIRTAPVVTGAALVMIIVFLSFSVSSFATMRNFGVAQAVGVSIDAFLIRLVVVPAMMRALGKRAWWMPAWLDRLLPGQSNSAVASAGGEAQ